jgi:hypothetical protein
MASRSTASNFSNSFANTENDPLVPTIVGGHTLLHSHVRLLTSTTISMSDQANRKDGKGSSKKQAIQ